MNDSFSDGWITLVSVSDRHTPGHSSLISQNHFWCLITFLPSSQNQTYCQVIVVKLNASGIVYQSTPFILNGQLCRHFPWHSCRETTSKTQDGVFENHRKFIPSYFACLPFKVTNIKKHEYVFSGATRFYLELIFKYADQREHFLSEVNNRDNNSGNDDTYCLQKRIKKFPL